MEYYNQLINDELYFIGFREFILGRIKEYENLISELQSK